MSQKSPQTKAKQAVKKAIKKNPKAVIITVIAIVLIVAIAITVLYFAFPEKWDMLLSKESATTNSNNNSNPTPDPNPNPTPGPDPDPNPTYGDNDLLIHFLNVGQGDCIYIQFPDGKDMIIDCGNKSSGYNFETDTLAYLNKINTDGTINYLMLTHCDEDHVEFLDNIIEEYQVNNIYMPNVLAAPGTGSAQKAALQTQIDALDTTKFTDVDTISSVMYAEFFVAALTEPNCNVVLNIDKDNSSNTIKIIEETYQLIFYCPTQATWDAKHLNSAHDKNAISPIGILTYNNRKIVLTGDANEEDWSEGAFVDRIGSIDCDVLKVGHHGSETSTTTEFLNAISCEYAVISCNYYGNTFGHPRQATIDRLVAKNMSIYRTDLNGNIVLTIDGTGTISFATDKTATKAQEENGLTTAELSQIEDIKDNTSLSDEQKKAQISAIVGY